MDDQGLVLALFYCFPVCLCITLLATRLAIYSRRTTIASSLKQSKYKVIAFSIVWWTQLALVIILLASILLELVALGWVIEVDNDYYATSHALLASHIAVCLYFVAGLLPDPDVPFTPTRANFSTWIVAVIFESLTIGVLARTEAVPYKSCDVEDYGQISAALRLATLLVMIGTFLWTERTALYDVESDCAERQSLIGHTGGDIYGATNGKKPLTKVVKAVDAQSTGWLDYFIGFRILFPYIWPSDSRRQQFIAIMCFLILISQRVINVLVPYQLGVLVEALGTGRMPIQELGLYVLYSGLQGQQGVLASIRAILWIEIGQSLYQRLTCAAFEHVLSLSLDFHLSKRIGEVMAAMSKGSAINTFLDGFAFQLFPMVFDLGVAAVYFFVRFNSFYSLIVLAVMWSYIFATIYMAKYRGRARREMVMRDRDQNAAKTDAIISYETVHHNCAIPAEVSRFRSLIERFQRAEFSVLLSLNALNAIQNFIFTLGILLILLLSSYQISTGLHNVAMLVSILAYFSQLQGPLAFFGSFYTMVQNNMIDAERMLELFKQSPNVVDQAQATVLPRCMGKITFSHVNFAYDGRKPALKDVSFAVEPGTSTAIVGESGSGKSTCLKLLFRFYNVNSGTIYVDDKDVKDVTMKSLRQYIGVVPQDTVLFNASLMYNILYARPSASSEEVYDACRAADIHHRILGFPDGYETSVGERGLRLSGGEKQRVAIARAILKQPTIMLLDEATSSLDSHTEKRIQGALETVTKGRTTITIAHRLSTITESDQILLLHEGKIVERGRHKELLALGGRYCAMWEKQTRAEMAKESATDDL